MGTCNLKVRTRIPDCWWDPKLTECAEPPKVELRLWFHTEWNVWGSGGENAQGFCFRAAAVADAPTLPEPHPFSQLGTLIMTAGVAKALRHSPSPKCHLCPLLPPPTSPLHLWKVPQSLSFYILSSVHGLLPLQSLYHTSNWEANCLFNKECQKPSLVLPRKRSPSNLFTPLSFICRAFGSMKLKWKPGCHFEFSSTSSQAYHSSFFSLTDPYFQTQAYLWPLFV